MRLREYSDNLQVMTSDYLDITDDVHTRASGLQGQNYGAWLDLHAKFIAARESQGLSQRQLAKKLGISQPAVSDFEAGGTGIKVQTLLMYAGALGLTLSLDATPTVD